MSCFYDHGNAAWLKGLLNGIGDLSGQCLLNLQALSIDLDNPGELANADNASARQVGDMSLTDDRHDMVLAVRFQTHVPEHDHIIVVIGLLEGTGEYLAWVSPVPLEKFLIGPYNSCRSIQQALSIGIIASPFNQKTDCGFRSRPSRAFSQRS